MLFVAGFQSRFLGLRENGLPYRSLNGAVNNLVDLVREPLRKEFQPLTYLFRIKRIDPSIKTGTEELCLGWVSLSW